MALVPWGQYEINALNAFCGSWSTRITRCLNVAEPSVSVRAQESRLFRNESGVNLPGPARNARSRMRRPVSP
jgi:hypothetical protein